MFSMTEESIGVSQSLAAFTLFSTKHQVQRFYVFVFSHIRLVCNAGRTVTSAESGAFSWAETWLESIHHSDSEHADHTSLCFLPSTGFVPEDTLWCYWCCDSRFRSSKSIVKALLTSFRWLFKRKLKYFHVKAQLFNSNTHSFRVRFSKLTLFCFFTVTSGK